MQRFERCAHKAPSGSRQRARAAAAPLLFSLALCAGGARADDAPGDVPPAPAPHAPATPAESHRGVPVGVGVGYAFKSVNADVDDRAHGVAADVVVDSPPLLFGFGLRGEGLALAWPSTSKVPQALGVFGGGGALTWSFDETAVDALASIGGVAVAVVDGGASVVTFAPTIGLLLRFPLTEAAHVDARVLVPFVVDDRFGLAAAATLGISVSPDVVVQAALEGRSPLSLLLPALD